MASAVQVQAGAEMFKGEPISGQIIQLQKSEVTWMVVYELEHEQGKKVRVKLWLDERFLFNILFKPGNLGRIMRQKMELIIIIQREKNSKLWLSL